MGLSPFQITSPQHGFVTISNYVTTAWVCHHFKLRHHSMGLSPFQITSPQHGFVAISNYVTTAWVSHYFYYFTTAWVYRHSCSVMLHHSMGMSPFSPRQDGHIMSPSPFLSRHASPQHGSVTIPITIAHMMHHRICLSPFQSPYDAPEHRSVIIPVTM